MAIWKRKKTDTETTLKIETHLDSTNITIFSVSLETGQKFAWDQINIPLETLKEMVNAQ
jgi:hypothetical protein